MDVPVTLLTAHKGVDLHAATARAVMRERLKGGGHLVGLFRCEFEEFSGVGPTPAVSEILDHSRFYNPNKHHYGIFSRPGGAALDWEAEDHTLPDSWPGEAMATDLDPGSDGYPALLGGGVSRGQVAVDVATSVRGRRGPVVTGVLWRLLLDVPPDQATEFAACLAITRGRTEGLLLNPHLEHWLLATR